LETSTDRFFFVSMFSFMAKDGRIYAIPENIDNVMVITPGDSASAEMIV